MNPVRAVNDVTTALQIWHATAHGTTVVVCREGAATVAGVLTPLSPTAFLFKPANQCNDEKATGLTYFVCESTMRQKAKPYKFPLAGTSYVQTLTIREIEILELSGRGLSVKGIARGLACSPGTVKWHVRNIYRKLGASSREDALNQARLRQIIQ